MCGARWDVLPSRNGGNLQARNVRAEDTVRKPVSR
jgi:hypothetical protein